MESDGARVADTLKKKKKHTRDTTLDGFNGNFFHILEIKSFCFAIAKCDLMQDVAAMFHLP